MNKICSNHFECNDSLAKRNDENEPGHLSNLVNGDDLKKDQTKKMPKSGAWAWTEISKRANIEYEEDVA